MNHLALIALQCVLTGIISIPPGKYEVQLLICEGMTHSQNRIRKISFRQMGKILLRKRQMRRWHVLELMSDLYGHL